MTESDSHDTATEPATDGDDTEASTATTERRAPDYLAQEVNLLRPSTPFMRDHLRVIWTGFVAWALIVFGPVTLTALAPDLMTTRIPLYGFPLHYFLVAIGAPTGALLLSVWYARRRDQLDEQYDISHTAPERTGNGDDDDRPTEERAATDGGIDG